MRFLVSSFLVLISIAVGAIDRFAIGGEPTRFTATVTGTGPDVLLIPGLASSTRVFGPLIEAHSKTYRFHAIQIHGFAETRPTGNEDSKIVAGVAEEIAEYIEAQKLDKPNVVGHSLGGEIALILGVHKSDRVGKLIIIDSLPFYPLIFDPGASVESMAVRAKGIRDSMLGMSADLFRVSQTQTVKMLVKTDAERAKVLDDSLASDRTTVANAFLELMSTDLRGELGNVKNAIRVVYAYDETMGVSAATVASLYANAYSAAKDVEFVPVNGSYHFVMLDQPKVFFETMTKLLVREHD